MREVFVRPNGEVTAVEGPDTTPLGCLAVDRPTMAEIDIETALYEARAVMSAPVPHSSPVRSKILAAALLHVAAEVERLRRELAKVRAEARVT